MAHDASAKASYGGEAVNYIHPRKKSKYPISMKHTHNHNNAPEPGVQPVPVCFEFTNAAATTVCIAGTFNHWQPEAKNLHTSGTGRWWKKTSLIPGTYEYCFVVDGKWVPDPQAHESVPNPYGGRNSILRVPSSPASGHLADAENLPLEKEGAPAR
jgi:1,4-alpha-glucan branching enzyme